MTISVGTFNLNNLFSRFNFKGAIQAIKDASDAAEALAISYEFTDPETFRIRTFRGRLVRGKDGKATAVIAKRIKAMNLDVLAVQEVEHVEILQQFNREHLNGLYRFAILVEGNDRRFIDVGILSKLPVGAVTSHQTAIHPETPNERIFGRDLLEVEILDEPRKKKLFTLYNNHLKSHFVPFDQDPVEGAAKANERRRRQAETIAEIVAARERPQSRYIILGDMNDPPESEFLAPMLSIGGNSLANGLTSPQETRTSKPETEGPGPQSPAWTYRRNPSGAPPPEHHLYDQIWLSPALGGRLEAAFIDRRTKHTGDGSDHDPAWIVLDL